jgi:hypothetical protein
MKIIVKYSIISLVLFTLTACLYPEQRRIENQTPYPDQIQSVQAAVSQFQQDTGILPIKNRDQDTPIYQKYPIDFNKLVPKYLQKPPGNAFESGGVFQYVLVNVEEDPTVKIIDLILVDEVRDLQMRVDQYRRDYTYPPFKDMLSKSVFTIDFEKLNYESVPQVRSPITGEYLPYVISHEGKVLVDYSIDLYKLLQNNPDHFKAGEDIRELIVENSFFVPVYSAPYTVKNGEPVFLVN